MNDLIGNPLFESHFDQLEKQQAARRATQVALGSMDPSAAAEGVQLGSELNIPAQAVLGAPELFRSRAAQQRATTALTGAPSLQDWVADPVNGSIASDDLDNLTWFEKSLGPMARAAGRGARRLSAAPAHISSGADVVRAGDVGKSYDQILSEEIERAGGQQVWDALPAANRVNAMQVAEARFNAISGQGEAERIGYIRRGAESFSRASEILRISSEIPMSDAATAFRDGTLSNAENTVMGTLGAFLDDPIRGAAFIAETAAETLPVLAASTAATAATRTPAAGAAVLAGGSFMMENTSSAIQFLEEKGVDLSTPEAAALVMQDRALMQEAQELGVERGLIIALFDAVSGGVAGQTLLNNPAGEVVAQGLAQIALGSGGEATAQLATTGEIDAREVVIEGLAELATAPIEVVGVGGRGLLRDLSRSGRSGETAAIIDQIDETVGGSQVKGRSAERFEDALRSAGLNDESMYVSADGLQEYFQSKDLRIEDELLDAWGIDPDDFREKAASGGDVAIPVDSYAARISGTEDAAWFRDNASFSPDEMSVSEAAAFNASVRDVMDEALAEAEAQRVSDEAMKASDVQIYDQVFSDLRAAGRSPDVAQNEASVWSAFWRSMGERYGEDPLDLARSMGVQIRGPQAPEPRRRGQIDTMLNTLRSQGDKALAPRGEGVLDFVAGLGGVSDRGGDVEALGAPKGVVAETRAEVTERAAQPTLGGVPAEGKGRGLDEVGRALIEAGYFPELLGATDVDEAAVALEAISEAVAGRDRFLDGEGPDQDLSDFAALLSERAIDLSMSNDEIVAALQNDAVVTPESFIGRTFQIRIGNYRGSATVTGFDGGNVLFDLDGGNVGSIPLDDLNGGMVEFEGGGYPFSDLTVEVSTSILPASELSQKILMIAREDGELRSSALSEVHKQELEAAGYQANDEGVYIGAANDLTIEADRRFSSGEWDNDATIYSPVNAADVQQKIDGLRTEKIVSAQNNNGQQYDQDGRLLTDTPEFRAWFGDSKVVDENGDPLVVYHGTRTAFDAFDPNKSRVSWGSETESLAKEYSDIRGFGVGDIMPLYMRIENPFNADLGLSPVSTFMEMVGAAIEQSNAAVEGDAVLSDLIDRANSLMGGKQQTAFSREMFWFTPEQVFGSDGANAFIEILQHLGFDGISVIERGAQTWGAFEPTQIKSVNNRGTFDASDPRILYQDVPGGVDLTDMDFDDYLSVVNRSGERIAEEDRPNLGMGDMYGMLPHGADLIRESDGFSYYRDGGDFYATAFNPDLGEQDVVGYAMDRGDGTELQYLYRSENPLAPTGGLTEAGEAALGRTFDRLQEDGVFDQFADDEYFQGKRGSIILPRGGLTEGQTVINLFESADLSTFLHESGHFFLEAFTALANSEGAPDAMAQDLEAIHKFLGVEPGAKLEVEQHETWARGFEAYLMEGKAPSLELASAFSRFKAWLSRIYKTVRGLDVKITPEIREVMDRMLATDSEIAAMRDEMGMRPLFSEAGPAGMSESDFATYQRMATRSAEQAEQRLMKRTMAKVRRETEAWFKAEKKAVREDVEEYSKTLPQYMLVDLLANQNWLGGDGQAAPDVQMDRAALVDMFGEGVIAELSRSQLGGKRAIYKKGGEDLGVVADMFGFDSVPAMVEALQNAGKRADFVKAETDRIMLERHGDPLNDGTIEEAAALAVHSEQQAATVATEARAIAKRLGRPTQNIKAKIFRQRARAMLGRMSVREASRPAAFLKAERTAAKAAERAFARVARGGRNVEAALGAAMEAKERQLLNSFLYKEALDFEKRLNTGREKMRSYDKKTVRAKLDGGYIEQIDALLERFDFRKRSKGQIQRAESLRAYIDRMVEEGREADLAIDSRLLDEARREHYTRLTVDEIMGLFDTIQNIDHMGRYKQTLIDRARKRDLIKTASAVAKVVRKRFGTGKLEKQSGMIRNGFNLLMRVDTIAADIDGEEIGTFYDEIKRGLDEGAATEQRMNVESAGKIEEIFSVYSAAEKKDLNRERVIAGGNGRPWTKQQVLALALNLGNESSKQRVLDPRVHESVRLTEAQMEATLSILDKKDWDLVQSIWDFVGSFGGELSDVTQRRTGVKMKRVEATPVNTPHGTYRGGYYPIAYDPMKSKAAAMDAESAFDKFLSAGRGQAAKVADGMAQTRQNTGGGRALNYDFSVMMKHVRDTTRVIAMSEPVDNAYRILNHEYVQEAFRDGGAANLLQTLNLFLQDVGAGPIYNDDPINNFSRVIKNNFTLSRLAFNLKTVALQVTGLGQSAAVIGKMNLLKGFNEYRKGPAAASAEVLSKSAFMAERQTTFQKDIYDQANDLRLTSPISGRYRNVKNAISAWGFAPMIKTQFYAVDLPTWIGAYQAEFAKNGGDEARAIHFADRMVDRSQGGGLMPDRNALERGTVSRNMRQSDFVRLWTTLGGYMVTKMNRGYLTTKQGAKAIKDADSLAGSVGAAANMATDLALLYVFEAAMMGLAYSLLSDDEDDEEVIAFMAKEIVGAGVGGIPFIRETVGAFNGYGAGGVLSSALEVPADIWAQIAQGENDKAFRRSVADAVGFASGLPTTQSMRIIEEVIEGESGSVAEAMIGRNPLDK